MSTFVITSNIKTPEDVKAARDELTKILAEIKKGGDTVKVIEPVANAGAGKAEEPKTPAKAKRSPAKKSDAPSAPVKGKKPVAKVAAGEEETKKPAVVKTAAKNTDGTHDFKFPAGASHTNILKEAFGADKKAFENAKKTMKNKYIDSLSFEELDAKSKDDHVRYWLESRNEAKAVTPVETTTLELAELLAIAAELNDDDPDKVGIYWHPSTGRRVTGPIDPEEGLDEVKFENVDYLVGENTKRVYNATKEFLGYAGIGKFKDM
jgi:translation initiation factor 1 (eIF-1/SUI1)